VKKTRFLGTATITPSGNIEVASSHEFRVRYRVGQSGIKTGGIMRVEVPGRLGWSRPHVVGDNEALGFTHVICSRKDVQYTTSIEPVTDVDFVGNKKIERWIAVRLDKGNLRPGDEITVIYGPHRFGYGPGVRTTHHAYSRDKNREEFTVCVDPDGKQGLQEISRSPGINMVPTTFMCYEAFAPSVRVVGEKSLLKITAWDRFYNPCVHHEAGLSIKAPSKKRRVSPGKNGLFWISVIFLSPRKESIVLKFWIQSMVSK